MNETEQLLNKLKKLGENDPIEAMDLFKILKEGSKNVSINTIMGMSTFLRDDFKHIQDKYKDHYTESILSQLLRINEIKKIIMFIILKLIKINLIKLFLILLNF
nr:DUF2115 family protein [Methanobrevibacter arboriphilus]